MRSGYSSQEGYELLFLPPVSLMWWDLLCAEGQALGMRLGGPMQYDRIRTNLLSVGADTLSGTPTVRALRTRFVDRYVDWAKPFVSRDAVRRAAVSRCRVRLDRMALHARAGVGRPNAHALGALLT